MRPSRYDLTAARREYVAAVGQLQQALMRFQTAGVPLSTDIARRDAALVARADPGGGAAA